MDVFEAEGEGFDEEVEEHAMIIRTGERRVGGEDERELKRET